MKQVFLTFLFFFGLMAQSFAATDICDINIGPDKKAAFALGETVTVTMTYSTDQPGGVRIYVRPFTNGSASYGYSSSASVVYMGSGVAQSTYSINIGETVVDEIRIEVYNASNTTLLRRLWVPVQHKFGAVGVHNVAYSHNPNLSSFLHNEQFTTYFKYNVNYPGGARVFIRPFSNGNMTPDIFASGSAVFNGTGDANTYFTVKSGKNVHVDQLRVRVVSADQTVTITEFFIPVNLYFSTVKVKGISAEWGNYPNNNEDRAISYSYTVEEAGGARIFVRPITNGDVTPQASAASSAILSGSGSKSSSFTIKTTNQRVDHVRFTAMNATNTEVLLEMYYAVDYTFGKFLLEDIDLCPSSSARMLNGVKVNINYNFTNDMGTAARVFVTPLTNGAPSSGYAVSGSPMHQIGSGSESSYFTINAGNVTVDQLRFRVTNADQSLLIADYFIPVDYVFGDATVPVVSLNEVVSEIEVYPNPTADDVYLNLSLKEAQEVQVTVMDLSGRLILDLGTREVSAQAKEQWKINTNSLMNGTYVVLIQGAGIKTAKKFVVMK